MYYHTENYQDFTCDEPLAFWSVVMMSLIAFDQCSGMELRANAPSCNKERFGLAYRHRVAGTTRAYLSFCSINRLVSWAGC